MWAAGGANNGHVVAVAFGDDAALRISGSPEPSGEGAHRVPGPLVTCALHPVRLPGRGARIAGAGADWIWLGAVRWAALPTVASRRNSAGVAGVSPPWWAREEVQGREAGGDAGSGSVPAQSRFLQPLLWVALRSVTASVTRGLPRPVPWGKLGPRPPACLPSVASGFGARGDQS